MTVCGPGMKLQGIGLTLRGVRTSDDFDKLKMEHFGPNKNCDTWTLREGGYFS